MKKVYRNFLFETRKTDTCSRGYTTKTPKALLMVGGVTLWHNKILFNSCWELVENTEILCLHEQKISNWNLAYFFIDLGEKIRWYVFGSLSFHKKRNILFSRFLFYVKMYTFCIIRKWNNDGVFYNIVEKLA